MDSHIPVLIVGAGPTGLMMACELARHGIQFRIIDKKPERTLTSNAAAIQPRTMEIFNQVGIVKPFLKEGHVCYALQIHVKEKLLGRVALNQIDSPYQFIVMLPQSETERLLTERLKELGHEVERSCELIDVKQETNLVVSTVITSAQKTMMITSDWLVACDGSNSMVRKKCGVNFPGGDLAQQFVVADAKMDSFLSNTEVHVFFDKGMILGVFALGSNSYRIAANIHQSHPRKIFIEKEIIEMVSERSLGNYNVSHVSWLSPFWIHSRVVEQMRKGNVFLVGDAAHVHSPVGGQGMNTGIQDAYNLAWKLALVIKGKANPLLLNSYHEERYPVVSQIVRRTENFTKIALFENFILVSLRNFILGLIVKRPLLLKKLSSSIAQLAIQYKESMAIDLRNQVSKESPKAGTRAPDVLITSKIRLYDYLHNNTLHTILLFSGEEVKENKINKLQELRQQIMQTFFENVVVYIITQEKFEERENIIHDMNNNVHRHYHIKDSAIYLLRPDNYIGYCSKNLDFISIQKFLTRYL